MMDLHKEMIGRLTIDFHRYRGMRGRSFTLESYYSEFVVSEILRKPKGCEFRLQGKINTVLQTSGFGVVHPYICS